MNTELVTGAADRPAGGGPVLSELARGGPRAGGRADRPGGLLTGLTPDPPTGTIRAQLINIPGRLAPESVKPDETRRVHALCATSSMGWLIHAMVGSFGGCGRRVKRVGLAA